MNPSVFLHGWRQVRRHSAGRAKNPLMNRRGIIKQQPCQLRFMGKMAVKSLVCVVGVRGAFNGVYQYAE